MVRISTPTPPLVTLGGLAVSDSEKDEALAVSLEVVSANKRAVGTGSH